MYPTYTVVFNNTANSSWYSVYIINQSAYTEHNSSKTIAISMKHQHVVNVRLYIVFFWHETFFQNFLFRQKQVFLLANKLKMAFSPANLYFGNQKWKCITFLLNNMYSYILLCDVRINFTCYSYINDLYYLPLHFLGTLLLDLDN